MEQYYLLLLVVATLFFWFLIGVYYSKKYNKFIKLFLDLNTNITVLYEDDELTFINSAGLNFFSLDSVDEFNKTYANLGQLFLPCGNCVDKYTYGKNWLNVFKDNREYLKVKLFSKQDNMDYYFNINISKMKKNNNYLLSFNDITKLESEKVTITKQAEYDALTKVYNRVKFNEVLEGMIYRANRYDFKFSIVLLDIDHFKAINDNHGHNVGDKVLIELARLINMSLRDSDVFARWGGEEFVIIAEETNSKEIFLLASRLQKVVSEYQFKNVGRVTCSFGVTEFKVGDTQALLFERVDEALYEAKDNGRNQVVTK
jgi:diguanylate cyclase (GGDEF)-like protein